MEQAEKELSLTAQRRSADEFAARHGAVIDHHYVERCASRTDAHHTVFNELLGDALQPGSVVSKIVVHRTSRFMRDSTHARGVKRESTCRGRAPQTRGPQRSSSGGFAPKT